MFAGIYPNELQTNQHKNLYTGVNSNFIHKCQNLEATKMYFRGEWINKLQYI